VDHQCLEKRTFGERESRSPRTIQRFKWSSREDREGTRSSAWQRSKSVWCDLYAKRGERESWLSTPKEICLNRPEVGGGRNTRGGVTRTGGTRAYQGSKNKKFHWTSSHTWEWKHARFLGRLLVLGGGAKFSGYSHPLIGEGRIETAAPGCETHITHVRFSKEGKKSLKRQC